MPETTQTSPSHVQSAARVMSEKKSNAPTRIFAFHGLLTGSVSTSTTYGVFSLETTPWVMTVSAQRAGPPFVSGVSSAGFGDALTSAANASFFAAPPEAVRILK